MFDTSISTILIRLCLLLIALADLYVSAKRRAQIEANVIAESKKELGLIWHVKMWFTGKAPAGILACLIFCIGFTQSILYLCVSAASMALLGMVWYSLWFDRELGSIRKQNAWYISYDDNTAITDKILRGLQEATAWSDKKVHLAVKIPLLVITSVIALVVCFM